MHTSSIKQTERAAKDDILSTLCNQIDQKKRDCNLSVSDRITRRYVASLVLAHQNVAPWVTHNTINNMYCRRVKKSVYCCKLGTHSTATGAEDVTPTAVSLTQTDAQPQERNKGGRPSGTTDKERYEDVRVMISTKSEIADRFFNKKKAAGKKALKRVRLDEIITEVKEGETCRRML